MPTKRKPFGCTDNHPFWSVDRDQFVEAGQLRIGENLQSADGTLVQVTRITPRRGPPVDVFNFEVDVDHVYHVGNTGVLVHNACNPLRVNMIDEFGHPGAGWQAAHIIPKNGWGWAPERLQTIIQNVRNAGLIDDIANGSWSTPGHAGTHTAAYVDDVIEIMRGRTSRDSIIQGIDEL
jgi:hypothetical protein